MGEELIYKECDDHSKRRYYARAMGDPTIVYYISKNHLILTLAESGNIGKLLLDKAQSKHQWREDHVSFMSDQ